MKRRTEMLSDLGGMAAAVIFDTGDVERRAVFFPAAFHRLGTEFLNIQLVTEWDPADRLGISKKDLERRKLIWT